MTDFAVKVLTAPLGNTHLFYVGQAGFIVKSKNGQLLGIDLYLSDCVERVEGHMGFKRLLPKIFNPDELEFEVLIATHPHFDHFDIDSIPLLMSNKKTVLYASTNCEYESKRLMMVQDRIIYVFPGKHCESGNFSLDFISCDHGKSAPDAVGVIITVDGKKIIITGDTCLRLDRKDEYLSQGAIDILVAPINGAYGNLNESECTKLSKVLTPRLTIPCHYGMFASHGGNVGMFYDCMKKENLPVLLMNIGEKYTL